MLHYQNGIMLQNYIVLQYHNYIKLRTDMAPKCEVFMNSSKKLHSHLQNQIRLPSTEYQRDHRCEGTNMAYKCKIFEAVNTAWTYVFCI